MVKSMEFPTLEEVRELGAGLCMIIPPEWEDRNGHVNVQFYLTLYELGGWMVLEQLGIDEAWFRHHGVSQFDLEHHLHYLAELRVGDRVSTYSRVLDRSDKRFHGMYFIVNETMDCLAETLEYITASVDMSSRRMAPFAPELAEGLDRLIGRHRRLRWPVPASGVMRA